MEYRIEHDSMGTVEVPVDKYYGAQTARSLSNFKISTETIPMEVIRAFAYLKSACAATNFEFGKLEKDKADIINTVCNEILEGKLDEHFPLSVWQTGSGTQSNMNVNEVITNRGNELVKKELLHPNDDVNMSQSSNDTFPAAMHIAALIEITDKLLPSLNELILAFKKLEDENIGIVKSGRTHLQDATPIAFSQEISGWRTSLENNYNQIENSLIFLRKLALGATAVGTGLNSPKGFDTLVAKNISKLTGKKFVTDSNKFHALSSKSELVFVHGSLSSLAGDLMKIANDIRWLSSGPRCGLGEIFIPENEPGSSIMPGKVNPTQCESMTMICVQVMSNNMAVNMASSQGNFELNVFMPVLIHNFLQSVRLLSDGIRSFRENCVIGIKANKEKMHENLHNSLMLVTAISPYIGYENAAKVAKLAHEKNISLKEATLNMNLMTEEKFDEVFKPEEMI